MDRQDVFDVARVITELAMNAESAGARRFDLTLSQGKLTAEDDGCGMSEEQFSLAKRGLFTTKGEGRGKGVQLINRFCKLQMQREGEITRITCTFTHLELGDIAGAVDKFSKFIKERSNNGKAYDIRKAFDDDNDFLSGHGISNIDMKLMADLITLEEV